MKHRGEGLIFEILTILTVIFIFWQVVILFAFWGMKPEGAFEKIRKLNTQLEIQALQNEELGWRIGVLENQFKEIKGDLNRKVVFKR